MEESQSDSVWSDAYAEQTADSLRDFRDLAGQALASHRQHISEIEARLNEQIQLVADELSRERLADADNALSHASQLQELQEAINEKELEAEAILEELAEQSFAFETQLAQRDKEIEQLLELQNSENLGHDSLQQELNNARQELEKLSQQECDVCAEASAELVANRERQAEIGKRLGSLQEQCQTKDAELNESHEAMKALEEQHRQTAAALSEAEQQLEQTLRKFELALADVHKLKRENAELHEELLSRPAADAQESPELVSLRAERDALATRVTELENATAPEKTSENQEELEDLQRRFELAVDDVRQLKQANEKLTNELKVAKATSAANSTSPAADTGPLDWQAQKARLLAELDAEEHGGVIDEPRREERASIEGTILITDRVVAEKDILLSEQQSEIETLNAQLENRPEGQDTEELREQIRAELLTDDEAVQAELVKLQEQQQQMDDKLREAELEISVQRAKLAREQASLEEQMAQFSAADDSESDSEEVAAEKPRRRWLSALGIKEDSE